MNPLIIIGLGTLLAWAGWLVVLFRFDPLTSGIITQILFQGAFAFAIVGTIIVGGTLAHQRRKAVIISRARLGKLLRQALLFVLFVILLLNMAHAQILRWWNLIPLALLILGLEVFFVSLNHKNAPYRR